jgi:hypothetical protein
MLKPELLGMIELRDHLKLLQQCDFAGLTSALETAAYRKCVSRRVFDQGLEIMEARKAHIDALTAQISEVAA